MTALAVFCCCGALYFGVAAGLESEGHVQMIAIIASVVLVCLAYISLRAVA